MLLLLHYSGQTSYRHPYIFCTIYSFNVILHYWVNTKTFQISKMLLFPKMYLYLNDLGFHCKESSNCKDFQKSCGSFPKRLIKTYSLFPIQFVSVYYCYYCTHCNIFLWSTFFLLFLTSSLLYSIFLQVRKTFV